MSARSRVRRVGHRVLAQPLVHRTALRVAARLPAIKGVGRALLGTPPAKKRRTKALDIRPGRMFTEVQGRRLPVVVLVALGHDVDGLELLADRVERAQLTTGSFRPLFVVDRGVFAPFRSRNYAVEVVMDEAAYREVNPHDAYGEYLFERVEAIASAYGARSVVPLGPEVLVAAPDHVLRLVGAVPPR